MAGGRARCHTGERTGELAGGPAVVLRNGWRVDVRTGGWTVERAGSLVGNHMYWAFDRRRGGLVGKQICENGQVYK